MANELLKPGFVHCIRCGLSFRYRKDRVTESLIGNYNIPVVACPKCGNSVHIVPSLKEVAKEKNSRIQTESL